MNKAEKWFRCWIAGGFPITAEALGYYRIIFALYLLFFETSSFRRIQYFRPETFAPPLGLASLFSGFPSYPALWALDAVMILCTVALLVGWQTRTTSILYAVGNFVGNSLLFSTGKIDHGNLGVTLLPLVLAFSGWGACFSMDARSREKKGLPQESISAAPLAMMALLLGFAYFSAGISKLPVWLDFDIATNGARSWVYKGYYIHGRNDFLIEWFVHLENRWFWEAMDIAAIIFECGFLLAAFLPLLFRLWLCAAVGFHLMNVFMLNISFQSMFIVYLLYINWTPLVSWVKQKKGESFFSLFGRGSTFLIVTVAVLPFWQWQMGPFDKLMSLLAVDSDYSSSFAIMGVGAIVTLWQIALAWQNWRLRSGKRAAKDNRMNKLLP